MKKSYLFPNCFKKIGIIGFIPFALLGIGYLLIDLWPSKSMFSKAIENFYWHIMPYPVEIICSGLIITLLLLCFSKEKDEDEYISYLRCRALIWAVIVNYAILLVALFLFYDLSFLIFMNVNMFTVLLLFLIKFNLSLYAHKKNNYEE